MGIDIQASAGLPGEWLTPYWNLCVGAGRANEGLRANWLEHLATSVEHCGFGYLRFHGLLHDDMFVYRERDGRPQYSFQYIDELFDRMLATGIRPFVELGFMPKDLAANDNRVFWWKANSCPPTDYDKWAELITALVSHWIHRYGIDEVRQWYFEVWNEPNLRPFWGGTKSEYFELYRTTAQAIKAIDEDLPVGGPATSNFVADDRFAGETEDTGKQTLWNVDDIDSLDWHGVWIEDFLDFCAVNDLPVDFIATHPYPTDFALDGHGQFSGKTRHADSTVDDLQWLRKTLDASRYPEAEIHLTEWSCSPSSRDHSHDFPQAATYLVRENIKGSGLVDSLSWWVFTDVFEEGGGGWEIFHGGFGLINFQGIPKPSFHGYRMLAELGEEELARGDAWIATRDPESGAVSCLAWHYPPEVTTAPPMCRQREQAEQTLARGNPEQLSVELTHLPPNVPILVETLDPEHGWALKVWRDMGSPHSPTPEQ
ncbi:MAG: GH39 family glycosyl hydrolase, partial [Planctomycetota bacterium]